MKIRVKADVSCSREWPCGSMTVVVPEQDGTALNDRGMTLLEMIVVLAVISILATLAIPAYPKYKDMARSSRAMSELRMLETAITAYNTEKGLYPNSLNDIGYGTLLDPWGHPYQYNYPAGTRTFVATPLNSDYDLYSWGADGLWAPSIAPMNPTSQDDIIRAGDGGYVGLASHY